jgi:hypothetical protein
MYAVPKDTFELTVVRVPSGGNTGDGKYFYGFSPEIVLAQKAGYLHIVLSGDCSPGIRIFAVVDNAGSGQMEPAEILKEGLAARIYNNMITPALISVAVVVTDDTSNEPASKYIVCDPQVINVPD